MHNTRTRIKICGITRADDAVLAAEAGADAIGLVFWSPSPRAVDLPQAMEISAAVGPFVTVVGLFVNAEASQVRETCAQVPLGCLQFHGREPAEFCAGFSLPWIKALPVTTEFDLVAAMAAYQQAQGYVLDSYDPVCFGGTGQVFDWSLVPAEVSRALILAGGLNPGNVAEAIRLVQPWAVDVSSGVESAPGVKDGRRMLDFIEAVRRA